jgi:hypothetical protein
MSFGSWRIREVGASSRFKKKRYFNKLDACFDSEKSERALV